MKKSTLLLFLCILSAFADAQYQQDILGNGFEVKHVQMLDDYEGKVIVSIIRKKTTEPTKKAVLYVHGFCDYFFQKELAEQFISNGYDFYAIDLRKYGRSILANQKPNNCRNLNEYFPDLDSALAIISAEGHSNIVLHGHSTGGLITSVYADKASNQKKFQFLVLNSPFFDINDNFVNEKLGVPFISFLGLFFPKISIPAGVSTLYGESINAHYKGEWEYNETWKPIMAFKMDAGWLRSIHIGQRQIKKKLAITQNVLVLSSDKSYRSKTWNEQARISDAVLDVNDIQKYADYLGKKVNKATIKNGLHDLSLSEKSVREKYYNELFRWLAANSINK